MSYTPPPHLKEMGARYEYVERPESPVETRHSLTYLEQNYDTVALAFPFSGDNLALMRAGQPRWPKPKSAKDKEACA